MISDLPFVLSFERMLSFFRFCSPPSARLIVFLTCLVMSEPVAIASLGYFSESWFCFTPQEWMLSGLFATKDGGFSVGTMDPVSLLRRIGVFLLGFGLKFGFPILTAFVGSPLSSCPLSLGRTHCGMDSPRKNVFACRSTHSSLQEEGFPISSNRGGDTFSSG